MIHLAFLACGFVAGICSGIFGIGGGVVLIPLLVFLFGYAQITATATSLVAMLLPVGILGVLNFYNAGKIDMSHIRVGLTMACGMFVGTYLGSLISIPLSDSLLRKLFAVFLAAVALRLWFWGR